MAAEIDIIINADAGKVSAELQKATNDLAKFERQLRKSTDVKEIATLQANISKLKTEINSLNAVNTKLSGSSNKAAYALNDLSRIAQDAPYGFIGIQNNINPLLESFQRLKKETGSTGSAFKAMLQSLTGPAGLGLAIGLISSALTFAAVGFDRWGASAKKAKEDTDKFKEGLDDAKSSALSTGQLLEGYVKIARDQTLTEKERNEAIREANKILGEHGEKLTLANIATEKVTEAVKLYTQATIAQAVAQKYSDKIADLIIKKNDLEAKQQILLSKVTGETTQRTKEAAKITSQSFGTSDRAALNYLQTQQNVNDAQDNATKNANEIASATKEIEATQLQLNKALRDSTFAFGELGVKAKDGAKKTKKELETIESVLAKLRKDIADEDILAGILGTPRYDVIKKDFSLVEDAITKLVKKFNLDTSDNRLLKLDIQISNLESSLKPAELKKYSKMTKEYLQAALNAQFGALQGIKVMPEIQLQGGVKNVKNLVSYAEELQTAFQNIATDAAIGFGEALGDAISGINTFGNFFDRIFLSLGTNIKQLGEQLIKLATLTIIVQNNLTTNPYVALAAGIALVALGQIIKNDLTKPAFAVGTRNAPGGMALVGERGPELVNLPRGSQVIPAAQTSNMMGGVGGSVEVFGVLRGQDIYFSNKKYGQTYGRTT
jgi:hypothetical protein